MSHTAFSSRWSSPGERLGQGVDDVGDGVLIIVLDRRPRVGLGEPGEGRLRPLPERVRRRQCGLLGEGLPALPDRPRGGQVALRLGRDERGGEGRQRRPGAGPADRLRRALHRGDHRGPGGLEPSRRAQLRLDRRDGGEVRPGEGPLPVVVDLREPRLLEDPDVVVPDGIAGVELGDLPEDLQPLGERRAAEGEEAVRLEELLDRVLLRERLVQRLGRLQGEDGRPRPLVFERQLLPLPALGEVEDRQQLEDRGRGLGQVEGLPAQPLAEEEQAAAQPLVRLGAGRGVGLRQLPEARAVGPVRRLEEHADLVDDLMELDHYFAPAAGAASPPGTGAAAGSPIEAIR